MILCDTEIRTLAQAGMIEPFSDEQMKLGVVSYGVSSYGYDVRIGNVFKVFDSQSAMIGKIIDCKSKDWHSGFVEVVADNCILIPANSFALGESVETFNIPRDILVICSGKSTYARCGIIVNVTPGEPEWKGKWTIEISNTTPLPAKVYCNEGIMQAIFLRADEVCERSYKEKKGKYQDQTGLTMAKVNEGKM